MADETIMIVEDDIISAEALREKLTGFGYTVPSPVDKGKDAIRLAQETSPDLVLMDIKLSGSMDGITAAGAIQKQLDVPVIYMTAYTDDEVLQRARITAPYSYMVKPLRDREILITIEMALYRHRMETRLKERERWLDTVLRSIGDAVIATDDSGRVNFMNPVAENLSGWSFSQASGKPFNEILKLTNEKTGKAAEDPVSRVIKEGKVVGLANHTILTAKDGTRRAIDDSAAPVLDENGRLTGVVMVFRDVTQRRAMEKELERYRGQLEELVIERTEVLQTEIGERKKAEGLLQTEIDFRRTIIDNIGEGLCVWEAIDAWPHIRFLLWNERMTEITGYSMAQINRKGWFESVYADGEEREQTRKRLEFILAGQLPKSEEHEITCADGKTRTVLLSASAFEGPQGRQQVLWLMWDITQRRQAERERDQLGVQLQQAQKMEAIGTLAGGIAHDFNNILGIIFMSTELAIMDAPEKGRVSKHMRQVMVAGHRAADLVQQILTFSRQQEVEKQPLRVSLVVKEVIKMLRATLPADVEIRQEIDQNSGLTLADPAQIHQIVMNLATNAAHAMQEAGGMLELSLKNVELSGNRADMAGGPGTYLKLSVSDTGCGMDRAIMERIFDPYFTTKSQDEGTGLGLAVVMGIVKDYGGAITVDSQPGRGTRFDIFLPRIDDAEPVDQPRVFETELPRGTERILFVDDEVQLCNLARNMLQSLGYRVEVESESLEARRRFRQDPQQFDLVISDVTMPKMTGDVLARELLRIRPDIPVILCTGFSRRIKEEQAKSMGIREYLTKPLQIKDLAAKIRQVLDD